MTNKSFVFPYSRQFAPYLRHIKHFNLYNVVAAVIPGKWVDCNQDASFLDEGETIGVPIHCDANYWLDQCDTVIWASFEFHGNTSFREEVNSFMESALTAGKKVICFESLTSDEKNKFIDMTAMSDGEIVFNHNALIESIGMPEQSDYLVPVPIISIVSMAEDCLKFHTELEIYKELVDRGYRVSVLSSKGECELIGVHSFPEFMFSNTYNEMQKIEMINTYVQSIIQLDQPDVLILGVPGGIIPFNDKYNMHFGITAYEVFCRLTSDYSIVNVWADYLNRDLITNIISICRFRYGIGVDAIGISNTSNYNDNTINDGDSQEYNVYVSDDINKRIDTEKQHSCYPVELYNLVNQKALIGLVDDIVDRLSGE